MAAENLATLPSSDALAGTSEATEFGAAIREMRLALNADLATVASSLRIRQVYLQAIEDGRFSDLPGPTYAAGFVRAYAEYLGLDVSEVMRRYREVALGSDRQAPLVAPSPVAEGTMPTGFILLVAAVLAAIAYGTWYYLTLHGQDAGDIVAKIPKQIAEIVGMDVDKTEAAAEKPKPAEAPAPAVEDTQNTADEQPSPTADAMASSKPEETQAPDTGSSAATPAEAPADTPSQASADQPAAPDNSESSPPVAEVREAAPAAEMARDTAAEAREAAAAAAAARSATARHETTAARFGAVETTPIPPPAMPLPDTADRASDAEQTAALPGESSAPPVPEPPSRVMLRATAISWVELRDASGKRVFSRLLKKGETYNVPGRSGMRLATGNAGALDVLVDGQTIGPLGPVGAVRRDVLMEPSALLRRINARQ